MYMLYIMNMSALRTRRVQLGSDMMKHKLSECKKEIGFLGYYLYWEGQLIDAYSLNSSYTLSEQQDEARKKVGR